MQCANCGKDLSDRQLFCSNCGSVVSRTPTQMTAAQAAPPADTLDSRTAFDPPDNTEARFIPTPRKKRPWVIAIIVLLVGLIGGSFVAYQFFGRDIRRLVLGPEKSYLLIEGVSLKKDMTDLAEEIAKRGGSATRSPIGGAQAEFQFKMMAQGASSNLTMMNIVNKMKFKLTSMYDRRQTAPLIYNKIDILTGSDALLSMETFLDNDQMAIGFPGLITQYLTSSIGALDDMAGSAAIPGADGSRISLSDMLKLMMTANYGVEQMKLELSLIKMVDVMLANIESASFEKEASLTVGNVSERYERYSVESSGKQMRDMSVGILELMRDEKPIYDLLLKSGAAAGLTGRSGAAMTTMTEAEWIAEMDTAITRLKSINEADLKQKFTQKIYVNPQDAVMGREIDIYDETGKKQVSLQILEPVKDGQNGYLISVESENRKILFSSEYQEQNEMKTGMAELMIDGKSAVTATFRNLSEKMVSENGYLVGEIDLNINAETVKSENPIPKITYKGSVTGTRYSMDITVANLASVIIDYSRIDEKDVLIPSLSGKTLIKTTDQETLFSLMTADVQKKLLTIIQKLGLDPAMLF